MIYIKFFFCKYIKYLKLIKVIVDNLKLSQSIIYPSFLKNKIHFNF